MDAIAILDFGSQYAQLIARRVREAHVYCELFPYDASSVQVLGLRPKGFILSGGPASVYEPGAPQIPAYVLGSGLPILGICYGMQAMAHALGGRVAPSADREFGKAEVEVTEQNPLLPDGRLPVWMSHGDRIDALPPGFAPLARSDNSPYAAMANPAEKRYGLQFHPEVRHTPDGPAILRGFLVDVCEAKADWTAESIIDQAVEQVRRQVGKEQVLAAVSGGVDSSVAAALVQRAVGDQLTCVFVDTGLLRHGEPESVVTAFGEDLGARLVAVNASEAFLEALEGLTDPEAKRRVIGEKFVRTFEEQAAGLGNPPYLVQGTIYPDVVESSAPDRQKASRIKTHHNVGGLPREMGFSLVEPLRYLFKDEVRAVGLALGLPESLIWRQPFPGPGLAVRCLGEVSLERLIRLRAADRIASEELALAGSLRDDTAQAFVVLLPVRSVGVMGDQRTYAETVVLRAVTTDDFMTADWARLPSELLARISSRIVNEVAGVNRVVYDITSKPPATIEWE
ncbi:MAG: glutamine-hydrolyzing GMP synthase [Chloroflexi bacterium RBG_19FT_COMBO_62_14]|nr:MAG: glutamine-hydrolyzing GMP synthase [Chloroflexi bacterium RBG_19FT_COMBO_62_14]